MLNDRDLDADSILKYLIKGSNLFNANSGLKRKSIRERFRGFLKKEKE
jgi:hypothetical protein